MLCKTPHAVVIRRNAPTPGHTQKVIANPNQLLTVCNATEVINSVFRGDKFIPCLVVQLRKGPCKARIVMDSASVHISAPVFAAFPGAFVKTKYAL